MLQHPPEKCGSLLAVLQRGQHDPELSLQFRHRHLEPRNGATLCERFANGGRFLLPLGLGGRGLPEARGRGMEKGRRPIEGEAEGVGCQYGPIHPWCSWDADQMLRQCGCRGRVAGCHRACAPSFSARPPYPAIEDPIRPVAAHAAAANGAESSRYRSFAGRSCRWPAIGAVPRHRGKCQRRVPPTEMLYAHIRRPSVPSTVGVGLGRELPNRVVWVYRVNSVGCDQLADAFDRGQLLWLSVDAEATRGLDGPARLEAVGRSLSGLRGGGLTSE